MTHSTASDMDGGFSHIGMTSGKLIIKAQLSDDIRKMPINNEEMTYDELIVMMGRLFKGKFDVKDDVLLKYRDEDGDLVTIADDSDLKFAIQCNRVLKLSIFPDGREPAVVPPIDAQQLSSDLHALMEQTNNLLESLGRKLREPSPVLASNSSATPDVKVTATGKASTGPLSSGSSANVPAGATLNTVPESHGEAGSVGPESQQAGVGSASLGTDASKEFDPLSADQRDERTRSLASVSNDTDIGSGKSLEGLTLNDRQPATIKPTVQQFQMQPNAPPKPIHQETSYAPTSQPIPNSPSAVPQQPPQPMYRYPMQGPPPPAQQHPHPPQMNFGPPPPGHPQQPGTFLPQPQSQPLPMIPGMTGPPMNLQQQQQLQQRPNGSLGHPLPPQQRGPPFGAQPQSNPIPNQPPTSQQPCPPQPQPSAVGTVYPTPSSTPAPSYPPPPMAGPQGMMPGQPQVNQNQPPNPLGPPPTGALGAPPMGPSPTSGPLGATTTNNPYARSNARGYMYPNASFAPQ